MDEDLPSGPRVIVGVDESPAARWALAWAIGAARLRRMALVAVHVSRAPIHPFSETLPINHAARLDEQDRSTDLVAQAFEEVAGGVPDDLRLTVATRLGEPGYHLVQLAREIDLLVLGRSRRNLLSRMLLPSTSMYCARHAEATVVLVRLPVSPTEEQLATERSRRLWWSD